MCGRLLCPGGKTGGLCVVCCVCALMLCCAEISWMSLLLKVSPLTDPFKKTTGKKGGEYRYLGKLARLTLTSPNCHRLALLVVRCEWGRDGTLLSFPRIYGPTTESNSQSYFIFDHSLPPSYAKHPSAFLPISSPPPLEGASRNSSVTISQGKP